MSGNGKQKSKSKSKSKSKTHHYDVNARTSKSELAGLTFPVARIRKYMKQGGYATRITKEAPVFLASILEYLTVEILELAGNAAKDNTQMRIKPRYIKMAISEDEELSQLLQHVTIRDGGVRPFIHKALISKHGKNGKGKGGKGGKNKGRSQSGSQYSESQEF